MSDYGSEIDSNYDMDPVLSLLFDLNLKSQRCCCSDYFSFFTSLNYRLVMAFDDDTHSCKIAPLDFINKKMRGKRRVFLPKPSIPFVEEKCLTQIKIKILHIILNIRHTLTVLKY